MSTSEPVARPTDEDLTLKSIRGQTELEFSRDPDGDMYIQITERRGDQSQSIYINRASVQVLSAWLNKVLT